jgi:hypothetical protein
VRRHLKMAGSDDRRAAPWVFSLSVLAARPSNQQGADGFGLPCGRQFTIPTFS